MSDIVKTPKEVVDTNYLSYAMYTLENRAIPSAIDGFKMVHRKLVYMMTEIQKGKKTKVADLGGLSKYGYHHGEANAMGAAITITAPWNNNLPIFEGHGNFGSRLIQEAASPRYIFASLSESYSKIFRDTEVAPKSDDETEHPEPLFYLPVIPWVLVNGISGIAVGYATNILPHSVSDLVKAVKSCVRNADKFIKEYEPIDPTFPSFYGTVVRLEDNQWKTVGIIQSVKTTELLIKELPVGYDRESYMKVLADLEEADKINDFEDECSDKGFQFRIKVSAVQRKNIDVDPIKYFKLEKTHTQNLTTLDENGKLKIFSSSKELIHYFVSVRSKYIQQKIDHDKIIVQGKIDYAQDKIKFIQYVINGDVDFKNSTKQDLLDFVENKVTTKEYGRKFVSIPLYECTKDAVIALEDEIDDLFRVRSDLQNTTVKDLFLKYLGEIK